MFAFPLIFNKELKGILDPFFYGKKRDHGKFSACSGSKMPQPMVPGGTPGSGLWYPEKKFDVTDTILAQWRHIFVTWQKKGFFALFCAFSSFLSYLKQFSQGNHTGWWVKRPLRPLMMSAHSFFKLWCACGATMAPFQNRKWPFFPFCLFIGGKNLF